jgi:cobalamin biosynthesis Mg chelatase CobN
VEVKTNLAKIYVESALKNGLSCGVNTCQNPQLHALIHNLVSVPGVLSPEAAQAFKELVERTAGLSLEDMTKAREELIKEQNAQRESLSAQKPQNVQDNNQANNQDNNQDAPDSEAVRGLKMEKVEDQSPEASSSGAEEWLLPIFALSLVIIFFIGYRIKSGRKKKES